MKIALREYSKIEEMPVSNGIVNCYMTLIETRKECHEWELTAPKTSKMNLEKSYLLLNPLKHMPSKTYKDKDGYWRFKDSDIPVHRWAAEKKLGRELRPGEVVHHKDRDKSNNDPDNLWVFRNQDEHDRVHEEDAYRHGDRASYQGFSRKQDSWFDDDDEEDYF